MSDTGSPASVWLVWAVLGRDKSLLDVFSSEEKARAWARKEGAPMPYEPVPYSTRIEERSVR